jgi:hypothetical protein
MFAGLMCSQSVYLQGFWPDFWAVLSVGLLLTGLMQNIEQPVAGSK